MKSIVVTIAVSVFMIVTLVSGMVPLSVVAVALSVVSAIAVFIHFLRKKEIHFGFWISYLILTGGVVLYFLIWGADPFWKRTGYNLMLAAIPIVSAVALLIWLRRSQKSCKYVIAVIVSVVMIFSSAFYFLAISMRARPKVFGMQKGHDEYLSSVKDSASASSPNILVILMDDMAYSDISCYSYLGRQNATIQTPNLDMLADEGVRYENFYSCSPVCSPSRFGILTGRYPARGYLDQVVFPSVVSFDPFGNTRYNNSFTFKNNVEGILGDEITVAEVLQSAGYSTALFGKWNLGDYGEYLPTRQGFDYFYGSYYVNDMTPYNWVREVDGVATEVLSHDEIKDQSETTKLLTAEINEYIVQSVDKEEKFFAYYATPWPHYPIYSGQKYDPSDDSYIHCIEEFDAYLGQIIDTLKAKGAYDNTLIMFTSDNGPGREGVAGALRGRKGTTFDGGQKMPMIVNYPDGNVGKDAKIITTPTMNTDIFPTLLQYAGISSLPQDRVIDGKSMVDLLEGAIPSDTSIHDTLYHLRAGKVQAVQMPHQVDNTTHQFKYYQRVASENTAFFDQVYKNYLFDLTADPAEGYNTSMIYPEIADKLEKQLEAFRNELKENRRGANKDYYG
ncbi:MAG: sulfatase-like hydrolase/transferase [Clostridia bacterium]|nr:sulfatase-like hydrolase/transferase [Clostridia bacterium]